MNIIRLVFTIFILQLSIQLNAEEKKHGVMVGAINSESPAWFKDSFLEFEEDVTEAAEAGKRVMIYFHQEGCPYCARLINENFADPETETFIRQNFDGVNINMWGDREVVSVAGRDFSEKTFAAALKVQFTPTLVFLDENGKVALRLDGYYPKEQFRSALRYVAERQEKLSSFAEYLNSNSVSAGQLIKEDFYINETNFQSLIESTSKPLAVFFEKSDCEDCKVVHQRVLTDAPTRRLVKKINNVQLDISSNEKIVTPNGESISIKEWATELDIGYTPSVVLFDSQGDEVIRMSALFKTFHFQSVFAYVIEKAYLQEPSFQRYISARAERIREEGFDTDIDGYSSSHQ